MPSEAKSRSNPDGLQGFLTKSGRKIHRQDARGEILNRLLVRGVFGEKLFDNFFRGREMGRGDVKADEFRHGTRFDGETGAQGTLLYIGNGVLLQDVGKHTGPDGRLFG